MTEDKKEIIIQLRLKGYGYKAIGDLIGKSRDSVRGFCKRNGLAGDPALVALNVKERLNRNLLCKNCKKPIKQKSKGRTRKFCSEECRRSWWKANQDKRNESEEAVYKYTCKNCGKEFSCYGNKTRKYCSHDCYIKYRFWSDEEDAI